MRSLVLLALSVLLPLTTVPARADPGSSPSPSRDGAWPLSPRPQVVSGFDPPQEAWGAGHRGVDLLGRAGQPVHAALAGTITFAAPLAGRGVVVVDHGDVRTTYEPVDASVHVGDVVRRGGVIGTLQRVSSHCFPRACLHWGLKRDPGRGKGRGAAYLNPLILVGAGPIRLLPGPLRARPPLLWPWSAPLRAG